MSKAQSAGQLAGAAAAGIGLAAKVVGPLAIPIGMALGDSMGGLFEGGGGTKNHAKNRTDKAMGQQHEYWEYNDSEQNRGYEYNVNGLKIRQENDENNLQYQDDTNLASWIFETAKQQYSYDQSERAYEKSVKAKDKQLGFNAQAKAFALDQQAEYKEQQLKELAFDKDQMLLDYNTKTIGIELEKDDVRQQFASAADELKFKKKQDKINFDDAKDKIEFKKKQDKKDFEDGKDGIEFKEEQNKIIFDDGKATLESAQDRKDLELGIDTKDLTFEEAQKKLKFRQDGKELAGEKSKANLQARERMSAAQNKTQSSLVAGLEAAGRAQASGSGRSAVKAMQAAIAKAGANEAAIADELMFGLQGIDISLDQIQMKSAAMRAQFSLDKIMLQQAKEDLMGHYQIDSDETKTKKDSLETQFALDKAMTVASKDSLEEQFALDKAMNVAAKDSLKTQFALDKAMNVAAKDSLKLQKKLGIEKLNNTQSGYDEQKKLNKDIFKENKDNIKTLNKQTKEQIKFDTMMANAAAKANVHLKPEMSPVMPKPELLPRPEYQDVYKPKSAPKPVRHGQNVQYQAPSAGSNYLAQLAGLVPTVANAFKGGGYQPNMSQSSGVVDFNTDFANIGQMNLNNFGGVDIGFGQDLPSIDLGLPEMDFSNNYNINFSDTSYLDANPFALQ